MATLVYTPEGAEPQRFEFDPDKLLSPEAELIERQTGWTFGEWMEKFSATSILAIHALLFVMKKRANPTLKWDEVVFSISEIDLEYGDDDMARARDVLEAKRDRDGLTDQEAAALEELAEVPKDQAR